MDIPSRVQEIVDEQGWNTDSLLNHALSFIEGTDNLERFIEYLRAAQEDEDNHCKRCGSDLVAGRCTDETCPFEDHEQSCERGFIGHPEYPNAEEVRCNCVKSNH